MDINKIISDCKENRFTRLDLGKCGLFTIPEQVFELTHIKTLILSNSWSDIEQGERVYSANNGRDNCIIYIPNKIKELKNLEVLILEGHFYRQQITNVESILSLKKLTHLNISYCCKATLFTSFLTKVFLLRLIKIKNSYNFLYWFYLRTKKFTYNCIPLVNKIKKVLHLKQIASNIFIDLSSLKDLRYLDIDYCHPISLDFIQNNINLSYLSASNNNISDISLIQSLQNLRILNLNENSIEDITCLGSLKNIKKLYLGENKITDITPLGNLKECEILNLFSNKISEIGPLQNLTLLKVLILSENVIANLKSISNLSNLTTLAISGNQISDLEPVISLIRRGIPIKVSDSTANRGIFIAKNPIISPPVEIIERGNDAVLSYYEEKEITGSQYLFECKLLVIGEGGVGKTSLVRKLIDINAAMPNESESTHGIQVHKTYFDTDENKKFRLHLWDFGGQEIYHATHQFFLTRRSLYLFVDDTRKDDKTIHDDSFNYWLQVVEMLGFGSPLIIIQNEKSDRSKPLDISGMLSRFPFIRDVKQTNLLTGRGINDLFNTIKYHVQQLPHIGELLPNSWLVIRKELEDISKYNDFISADTYLNICYKNGLTEDKAIVLSNYLHDLGIFLHFRDNISLKNIFILNNQWATDAVYKVLDNENVKNNNGKFTRVDLDNIWSEEKYSNKHDELISLMEKFELCYKLKDSKNETWLAPQLLPIEKPAALNWLFENELVVRYKYDFMPKGIMSRFIVRMHIYIKDIMLTWRKGVVLERKDAKALITETWGLREIVIRATGGSSKELITIIVEDFDNLHNRFDNLRVEKLIPCICKSCKKSNEPHFFEYSRLESRKSDGKSTIECDRKPYEQVEISKMLDGIFSQFKYEFDSSKILSLISDGKIEDAIKGSLILYPEIIVIQGRLSHASKEYSLGKINIEEYDLIRQKISSAVFDIIKNDLIQG